MRSSNIADQSRMHSWPSVDKQLRHKNLERDRCQLVKGPYEAGVLGFLSLSSCGGCPRNSTPCVGQRDMAINGYGQLDERITGSHELTRSLGAVSCLVIDHCTIAYEGAHDVK